jgi:hypothetical protein
MILAKILVSYFGNALSPWDFTLHQNTHLDCTRAVGGIGVDLKHGEFKVATLVASDSQM